MGVPAIWELLKPYIKDKRISLKRFVTEFKSINGRTPIIAIDGHNWLFECGFFHNESRFRASAMKDSEKGYQFENGKPYLNLINKIRDLLVLEVTFIIVFDGDVKPLYKGKTNSPLRNVIEEGSSESELLSNYCDQYHLHEQMHDRRCMKTHDPTIKQIQELFDAMGISYMMSCTEGEILCAWLQKAGKVDYVLSNDSDALMFGATKVLRNYSKNIEDRSPSSAFRSVDSSNSNEYYLTVVDLEEINKNNDISFDSKKLLFFSILMGGDYNIGLSGLGKTKALILSNWKDPNFVDQFFKIFRSINEPLDEIIKNYSGFQEKLFQYCREHGKEMFGRNYKLLLAKDNYEGWPSPHLIYHYLFPIINTDFSSLVFDPTKVINVEGSKRYRSINLDLVKRILDMRGVPSLCKFDTWFHRTVHEFFLLRQINLFPDETVNNNYAKITDQKTDLDKCGLAPIEKVKIRYKSFLKVTESWVLMDLRPDSPEKHDHTGDNDNNSMTRQRQIDTIEYPYVMWIPKLLITPKENVLVVRFKNERSKAITTPLHSRELLTSSRSPKKRKSNYSQNNTLDGFLSKHSSPLKTASISGSPSIKLTPGIKLSPTKSRIDQNTEEDKVRRKLFIDDDDDEVQEAQKESQEEEEDSLIIVEERQVKRDIEYLLATSPLKRRNSSFNE